MLVVRLAVLMRKPRLCRWPWEASYRRAIPDPADPKTMNDKFLWRKLFDHDPRFPVLADKIAVKARIAEAKPNLRVPELYWRGRDAATIREDTLAGGCAVRANRASGKNILLEYPPGDREVFVEKGQWLPRLQPREGAT